MDIFYEVKDPKLLQYISTCVNYLDRLSPKNKITKHKRLVSSRLPFSGDEIHFYLPKESSVEDHSYVIMRGTTEVSNLVFNQN